MDKHGSLPDPLNPAMKRRQLQKEKEKKRRKRRLRLLEKTLGSSEQLISVKCENLDPDEASTSRTDDPVDRCRVAASKAKSLRENDADSMEDVEPYRGVVGKVTSVSCNHGSFCGIILRHP